MSDRTMNGPEGSIVLPKKISLAIAAGFAVQFVWLVFQYATTQELQRGDIERLKRDVAVVGLINERTIRIEEQLVAIRASLSQRQVNR